MKHYFFTLALTLVCFLSYADGILENFETGLQDPFNGISSLTWIGDVGDFEIVAAGWPYGSTPDFSGSYSLRARADQILNSTILTDVSSVYTSEKKIKWQVFISGASATITVSKGAAIILFVNSNKIDDVEAGLVNGYRLRLCDPSQSGGWEDGLYFEKANGSGWLMIDSLHTINDSNINQGWNIVVEREVGGNWTWGYSNGDIGTTVSLTENIFDNSFSDGDYSGMYWYSLANEAKDFGFDNFKIDPYTPNLWKSEAASTDWSTASNWDDGVVPSISSNIQIEAGTNQPIILDNTSCNNLLLEPGANLTVSPELTLSVNGNFTLQSDASGTASIIDHGTLNISGESSIQRYMQCFDPDANDEYHFLSIPIANHTVESSLQNYYVYPYNESQNEWTTLSSGEQLLKGKGYTVYYSGDANHCVEFSGTPSTGDQIISITATNFAGNTSTDNWNLIGNPFPSPIDWDEVTKNNIESAIYIWKAESCTYASYVSGVGSNFNDDGIIPAMQGFFVHATSSGNLTIPQTARVHNQTQYYLMKNSSSDPQLRIQIKNQIYSDECVVRFKAGASEFWDNDFDALKFLSEKAEVPQIFTLIHPDLQASINTLPGYLDVYEIPIVSKVDNDGIHEICVSNVSSLIQDYDIILKNKINGESYQIMTDSCLQLNIITGEIEHFTLILNHKKTAVLEDIKEKISIKVFDGGEVVIEHISQEFIGGELKVFSLDGKEVFSSKLSKHNLQFSISQGGLYIVQLKSNQKKYTQKIIIL